MGPNFRVSPFILGQSAVVKLDTVESEPGPAGVGPAGAGSSVLASSALGSGTVERLMAAI